MPGKTLVFELCSELEQELIRQQLGMDTLKRYRKVLKEFSVFGGEKVYSQSLGTEFLIQKFKADGGISITDEHSRTELYYFKCIRLLAEYYNFGIVHIKSDFEGEIIWPDGFRTCTEAYFEDLVDDGLSYGYINRSRTVIKDLILFLDDKKIHEPQYITAEHNDAFIKSYYYLSPKGIASKLCILRRYYRFLYLNQYIQIHLAEKLPHACINGRMKIPTVWTDEEIAKIKLSAERVSPSGKRAYAMIILASELGLRIGDIRNLKLADIDWIQKKISIVQHKTKNSLVLPLTEEAGWALIDYIKDGRPVTDSPNVFVKHRQPYDAFPVNSTMNHILSAVLNKAGIPSENKNYGWHTFRRSLATKLLQSNVEMSTISEILGHSDPDIAGRYYIRIDTQNLKKCMLDLEVMDYVRR
ncbi:MAG: site-specific integrase [Lachnospiraceae bacterium]